MMRSLRPTLLITAAIVCAASGVLAATGVPAVAPATGPHLAAPASTMTAAIPATAVPGTQTQAQPTAAAPTATADAEPPPVSVMNAPTLDATPAADAPQTDPNDSDGIAATVNDQSISDYEVRQRISLFIATSGINPDDEAKKRIRSQIIGQLENEKIQLQEALKKHITVSPTEIDKSVNRLVGENRFTIDQLRTTLVTAGSSEAALRSQILAQIAWQKAVQDEYEDRVNVTPAQIDAEMAANAEGANKPHFLVGEIFLPVDSPEQDAKVLKDVQTVESQLQMGAPFQSVARQFSQSPSAAGGGDIGWVHEGQLAPELNAAVEKLTPGTITAPIRGVGGYYILILRDRQEPAGTKIVQAPTGATNPDGTMPLARLLLPVSPQAGKEVVEGTMKVAMQVRARLSSCEQLDKYREQMPGSVYMNLGDTKLTDLSPEIQKALAGSHPGDVATPFLSEAGVELIARCDKKVVTTTAYVLPTRQQVEEQLFDQQISAFARRYLRDLKRDANIQVRDEHGAMQLAYRVH